MSSYLLDRMDVQARGAVTLAHGHARQLFHNYIGTEHLLLGLIEAREGISSRALLSYPGVNLERTSELVKDIIGMGQVSPTGHMPYTPRAKKVLELALREALQLGSSTVRTEHILLGIVREGEGVGAQVLGKLGVELDDLRRRVYQLLVSARYGDIPGSPSDTPDVDDDDADVQRALRILVISLAGLLNAAGDEDADDEAGTDSDDPNALSDHDLRLRLRNKDNDRIQAALETYGEGSAEYYRELARCLRRVARLVDKEAKLVESQS